MVVVVGIQKYGSKYLTRHKLYSVSCSVIHQSLTRAMLLTQGLMRVFKPWTGEKLPGCVQCIELEVHSEKLPALHRAGGSQLYISTDPGCGVKPHWPPMTGMRALSGYSHT